MGNRDAGCRPGSFGYSTREVWERCGAFEHGHDVAAKRCQDEIEPDRGGMAMTRFAIVDTDPVPYLYVDCECDPTPEAMGAAMAQAFGTVMGFLQRHGIRPAGRPISVYHDYDPARMRFRVGMPVGADALRAAEAPLSGDTIPAGRALRCTHVGPYGALRETYEALERHMDEEGLTMGAVCWESYVDDPAEVPPERLRTDIHMALG
ncbi:AraC family transcriptional regulator [Rhodobacteraceae bacterium CCMM004]|nr:AraC family transcriptional regulator [Rhodobacteraceae bacterium CCMM004]